MNFNFSNIHGPKQSVRDNFELLICQLLSEEINAIPIDGKGGDGGVDCFITNANGDIEIFQVKYFINNLSRSQKTQIEKSFKTVCQNKNLSKWILCIPRDHTPAEKLWFDSINSHSLIIEWWGETKIRNLLAKHPEIGHQFFREEAIIEEFRSLKIEIRRIYNETKKLLQEQNKIDKAPNTLPRTIPVFIGRKTQISALRKLISKSFKKTIPTVVISSIDGMPGVGKTALAVQLAHILTAEYPDAQLFIDCYGYTAGHQPLTPEQILDSLLFTFGVPVQSIPKGIGEKSSLWRSVLTNKSAIIILDNVKTKKQVEPIIYDTTGSLVLITSRNRLIGLADSYHLPVRILSKRDSVSLIRKIVGPDASEESSETLSEIAKQCGYLPLTLHIISDRWRKKKSLYAKGIIERLKNTQKRSGILHSEYKAVDDVFDLSYESLTKSEKQLFKIMGLHPGLNLTIGACAAMLRSTLESTTELVESLFDQSLVLKANRGRYKLHDLLRDYAQQKHNLEDDKFKENQIILQLIEYYLLSLRNANNFLHPNDFRIEFDLKSPATIIENFIDVESTLSWLKEEFNNLFSVLEFAKKNDWEVKYWQLSQAMATYLKYSMPSWLVIQVHSQALQFSQDKGDLEMCASSLTELALSLLEAGDFIEAEKLFIKSENLWRILRNDAGLAYTLNGHGFTLERLGRYPEALSVLNDAKTVAIKNPHSKAFTLNAIGAVYWRMEEYSIALPIFREARKNRKKVEDFIGFASTTNNIAFSNLRLGYIKKAINGFLDALKIFRTYHNYHGEAVALNNLGYTAIDMKDFEVAINYAGEARNVASKVGNYYQIGRSYDVEGKAFLEFDNRKGIPLLQEALRIFETLHVPEGQEIKKILSRFKLTE